MKKNSTIHEKRSSITDREKEKEKKEEFYCTKFRK